MVKPNGHNENEYARVRIAKETYNEGKDFLGVHYSDCMSDKNLEKILEPYIGIIAPYIFKKPHDKLIETAHWSNADELLETCKQIAEEQPDGKFPTEDWLRKRGRWKNREGKVYNTVAVYIKKWIGGTRKVRELLGQSENSTVVWNRDNAIQAYKEFYIKHGKTPSQMRNERRIKNSLFSDDIICQGNSISAAVLKYVGGAKEVEKILGIEKNLTRKWTEEKIIEKYREVINQWEISPSQLLNDHRIKKITLTDDEYFQIAQVVDAAIRKFGSSKKIYEILDFKPPARKRRKRRIANKKID